jgi:uncharacterized membrane protein
MNMTKRLEKLAIIAIVLWFASLVLDPILMLLVARLASPESFATVTAIDVMPISIKNIVSILIHIGVAAWLFKQAKRDGNSPWIWTLFGLVFSIIAVIMYLLSELVQQFKGKESDNQKVDHISKGSNTSL